MSGNEWVVARTTPWPDGERCVEIASDPDSLDPSLLWEDARTTYSSLAGPHDDMREAVEAAIRMRDEWQSESGETVVIGWASSLYPVTASPRSDEELRKAAEDWYAALPCCEYCGEKLVGTTTTYLDTWGDPYPACNDWHAHLVECDRFEQNVVAQWEYWNQKAQSINNVQARTYCLVQAAKIADEYRESYGSDIMEVWGR